MKVAGMIGKVLFVVVLFCGTVNAAPHYVTPEPLGKTTHVQVGEVKNENGLTQVDLISWGGDIATALANGNSPTTTAGSIFGQIGLNLKLMREDYFAKQVEPFLSGKTPYLRGTIDMISMAAEVANRDPRTTIKVIYSHTKSAGGDCMVVKDYIKNPQDLKGKVIALQFVGPHMYYLARLLADAGLSVKDVTLVWTKDLTGSKESPLAAFYEKNVDAAMMISPDANTATAGGTVGTGGESYKGARILLSTKTADSLIFDIYAVRTDYYEAHRSEVEKFVQGLLMGEEALADLMKDKNSENYKKMIKGAAKLLMDSDSAQAVSDTEGMYGDCVYLGWKGNVKFFTDQANPRNFERVTNEVQTALISMGLMAKKIPLAVANWDYAKFAKVLKNTDGVEAPRFDTGKVAQAITQMQAQGTKDKNALFAFTVNFKPNQNSFSADLYAEDFKKVIETAAVYGGALITVEGHSDPLNYIKRKKAGASKLELDQIKQAAKNLSFTRANSVRDNLIEFAKSKTISVDPSQFTVIGYGISNPSTGMCGDDPCAPKTEQEWLSNMKVEFKIIQIEAEMSSFEAVK